MNKIYLKIKDIKSGKLTYWSIFCFGAILLSYFIPKLTDVYAAPTSSTNSGKTLVTYETYEMSGSHVLVPATGNKENSQNFPGYNVYEYYYPANPAKNNSDRKVLYSYNKDGSVSMSGNLVVKGDRTQMHNEYSSGNMAISSYNTEPGAKENKRSHVTMTPRSNDTSMDGGAYLNTEWNPNDKSGLGPSVFLNPDESKLEERNENYLSSTKKDIVIETSLTSDQETFYWKEFFETGSGPKQLLNPTALFRKDTLLWITDAGNRRIVGYSTEYDEFLSLGKGDWNWMLNGITADDDGYVYVTDSNRDIIIRTSMSGQGWKESYRDIDDYQSRLYLEGGEHFKSINTKGSFAQYAILYDCGYNSHEVIATSSRGYINIDPANNKPLMQSKEGCAFGNACFQFDGYEYMDIKDSAAWNFGDDMFTMDMWVKFDALDHASAIVSHNESYLFELNYSDETATTSLVFAFLNEDRDGSNNFTYQTFQEPWAPEVGEWYHLAIVRSEQNELMMFVDGEMLGEPVPITGKLRDGDGIFQIGAYGTHKRFMGKMDEIRVARGRDWMINYADYYQFDDPKGIVLVGNDLYIVDSGHNRIVKMNKSFEGWSTFGDKGSGNFQFNNPTDIYYYDKYFYITDTGNHRVVKTDMSSMVSYLKGVSGGSWEVVYSSDSPDLHGVMVDAENLIITDAYNGQIIKNGEAIGSKNPWDLLNRFTSPVDVQPGPDGHYYVLDGTSNYDFSAHITNRSMDLYGTSQKQGINMRMNEGGVITDKIRSQGVVAKLNYPDWYSWVGDDLGPPVAHCGIHANEKTTYGACSGGGIWTGLGNNVDCTNTNNAPPSECVGQWDWEIHWPYCTRYMPSYELVDVCLGFLYCNEDSDVVADGTQEGDYICGCAQWTKDCFSYCSPVDMPCHEGIAVAYSFYEAGPPEWYLYGNYGGGTNSGGGTTSGGTSGGETSGGDTSGGAPSTEPVVTGSGTIKMPWSGAYVSVDKILQRKFVFSGTGPGYGKTLKFVFSDGQIINVGDSSHMAIVSKLGRKYQPGGGGEVATMEVYADRGSAPDSVTLYYDN